MAQAPTVNIADIIAKFRTVGAAETAEAGKLDTQEVNYNTAVGKEKEATIRAGELTGQIHSAVDQLKLDATERNQRVASEFFTNPDAQNYVLADLAEKLVNGREQVARSAADISEKMKLGFTDDPLQWIVQQFTLPREVHAHNAQLAETNIIYETMKDLQSRTTEQMGINTSIAASTSKTIMADNAELQNVKAQKEAEHTASEAAKQNIHIGTIRSARNQNELDNIIKVNRTIIDNEQLAISKSQLALATQAGARAEETLTMQRAEFMDRQKELSERHKSEALQQIDLDRATKLLGYRDLTVRQYKELTGPMKSALEFVMVDPDAAQGRLGPDPVKAVKIAEATNAPLTPETTRVKHAIQDMMAEVQSEHGQLWQQKKPAEQEALQRKGVQERMNRILNNIPDSGSMFSAPPMQSVASLPGVAQMDLWKNYLTPLAENETVKMSAQQMYDIAVKAVVDQKIPLKQAAAEIAGTYKLIVEDNWYQRDYNRFGALLNPTTRNKYTTRITSPNFGYGTNSEVVDMTNAAAVENRIMRHLNTLRTQKVEAEMSGGRFTGRPENP